MRSIVADGNDRRRQVQLVLNMLPKSREDELYFKGVGKPPLRSSRCRAPLRSAALRPFRSSRWRARPPGGPRSRPLARAPGCSGGPRLRAARRSPPGTSRRPGTRVAGAFAVPASSDRLLLRTARSKPSGRASQPPAFGGLPAAPAVRGCAIARRSPLRSLRSLTPRKNAQRGPCRPPHTLPRASTGLSDTNL